MPIFLGKITLWFLRTWSGSGLSHHMAICQENWVQVCWVATHRWFLTISMTVASPCRILIPRKLSLTPSHLAGNPAFFTTASSTEVQRYGNFIYQRLVNPDLEHTILVAYRLLVNRYLPFFYIIDISYAHFLYCLHLDYLCSHLTFTKR